MVALPVTGWKILAAGREGGEEEGRGEGGRGGRERREGEEGGGEGGGREVRYLPVCFCSQLGTAKLLLYLQYYACHPSSPQPLPRFSIRGSSDIPERLSADYFAMPVGVVNEAAEAVVWLPLATDRGFVNRVQY